MQENTGQDTIVALYMAFYESDTSPMSDPVPFQSEAIMTHVMAGKTAVVVARPVVVTSKRGLLVNTYGKYDVHCPICLYNQPVGDCAFGSWIAGVDCHSSPVKSLDEVVENARDWAVRAREDRYDLLELEDGHAVDLD